MSSGHTEEWHSGSAPFRPPRPSRHRIVFKGKELHHSESSSGGSYSNERRRSEIFVIILLISLFGEDEHNFEN